MKLKKKKANKRFFKARRRPVAGPVSGSFPPVLASNNTPRLRAVGTPFPSTPATILFVLFLFFLPTQFGKHFFPPYSYLNGVRVDYLSPTIYLIDILVFLAFIFNIKAVINFFKKKTFLIFFGLLIVNVILAKNQSVALYQLIKTAEFLVVFCLGRELFKFIKEKFTLIVLLLAGVFQLTLAVLQLVSKHSLQGIFYYFGERLFNLSTPGIAKATLNGIEFLRPYGTFSHPNSMAGFFLLLYFFVLTYKNFSKHFFLKYFLLFISSILIFITFSKVAILTFLILNTFYYILNTRISCLPCKIARIAIPIIISIIFFQATTDPLTVDKRIELVKNSLIILKQSPFFGVGLGNYLIVQSQFSSKYFLFFNQPVHNIFLLFICELGIIITSFLLFQCVKALKSLKIKKEFLFIILAVVLTGLFDHYWLTLQQNLFLLALIYGVVSNSFLIVRLRSRS